MTEKNILRKIGWFEKFAYQLIKNVNHSLFHKEREVRLKQYKRINAAAIKVFAHRLTYENFEMLESGIRNVAHEIALPEVRDRLSEIEAAIEINPDEPDSEASDLLNIILLLLYEQVNRFLRKKEEQEKRLAQEEKRKKAKNKGDWFTAMPGGVVAFKGNLSPAKDKSKPDKSEEDAAENKAAESSSNDGFDSLLLNLGDEGLDDLIYGKKRPKENDEKNEDEWMGWID